MILIQRIKKIKGNKILIEVVYDLIFYGLAFVFMLVFLLILTQNRTPKTTIITKKLPPNENIPENLIGNFNFVASSRGKYFYDINSERADGLSNKNKVYFYTEEEAKNAGFKPYFEY